MGIFNGNVVFWWFVPHGEGSGCSSVRGGSGPPGQRGAEGAPVRARCRLSEFRCPGAPRCLRRCFLQRHPEGPEGDWAGLGAAGHGPHPRRVPGTMGSAPTRGESVVSQSSPLPGIPTFCYRNPPPAPGPLPILPLPLALLSLSRAWEKRNLAVN